MSNDVLHGYYQLGGESISDGLEVIAEQLNEQVRGRAVTRKASAPQVLPNGDLHVASVTQGLRRPAYRDTSVDDLKMSLFYTSGGSLIKLAKVVSKSYEPARHVPWGRQGLKAYLSKNYPLEELFFNGMAYKYIGLDRADRPYGYVKLVLDKENDANQPFLEAQAICHDALKFVANSRHVKVKSPDTLDIGRIIISNTTSEIVSAVVNEISADLETEPLAAKIGSFVFKQRMQ